MTTTTFFRSILFSGLFAIGSALHAQAPADSAQHKAVSAPQSHKSAMPKKDDTLYMPFQFAFVPFLSTNGLQAGNTINAFSFNVIAGFSRGTSGFEIAGVANINRNNVQYCQIAGSANIVGGSVRGTQIAGGVNIVHDSLTGYGMAGSFNFARALRGVQVAGGANITVDSSAGAQIAGGANRAGKLKGAQIAGGVNIASDVQGMQLAGGLNIARKVKGLQLGVVNIADSVDGVSIGVLSFVRHGYHKIEVFGDELIHANIGFRTGTDKFHNILFAGISTQHFDYPLWSFGYGIGSRFRLADKWNLQVDLSTQQLMRGQEEIEPRSLHKVFIGIERPFFKKFSVCVGPTLNLLICDTKEDKAFDKYFSNVAPYHFYHERFDNNTLDLKAWVGGKISIKFL